MALGTSQCKEPCFAKNTLNLYSVYSVGALCELYSLEYNHFSLEMVADYE